MHAPLRHCWCVVQNWFDAAVPSWATQPAPGRLSQRWLAHCGWLVHAVPSAAPVAHVPRTGEARRQTPFWHCWCVVQI